MVRPTRLAFGALALLALPAAAQQKAPATSANRPAVTRSAKSLPAPMKGASVEGITEYRLANGMKVLLFPDQTKPQTTVNITYLVGSRQEGLGESGMAHLLEHMVFKGTPKHPNIPGEFSAKGAIINGTTWLDRTNYFETFSASDANLEWAIELEADRMINSNIAKKDLETEFSVVRNEFEGRENSPLLSTFRHILPTAYHHHTYGKDAIGNRSDIEGVKIENLQRFYRKWYQPDNAVLMIAGKFDEAKALQFVHKYFSPIPRPNRTLEDTYTVEPVQEGLREVRIARVGDTQMLGVFHHLPAGTHPDYAAADLFNRIMTDAPAGRLYKALVEGKKAASITDIGIQTREPGGQFWFATVRKEDPIDSARAVMDRTIAELASRPITAEEVDRAKTAVLKEIQLSLTKSDEIGLTMSEWIAMGDWRTYFMHRDRIEKLTPADVQRVALAYFKPTNRTYGFFQPVDKPDRAEIPTISVADVQQLAAQYKGKAVVAQGEAFDPTPKNIEGRALRSTIAGGTVKVAFLPKKTRGETVNGTLNFRFGTERTLANRGPVPAMVGQMLMRGTTSLTRQALTDSLDKLKARMSVSATPLGSVSMNFETVRANLPAVLALAKEVFRAPRFDSTEFAALQRQQLAGLEAGRGDPQQLALNALQRSLAAQYPKGHPRYVPTIDESIAMVKAVTVDSLRSFYNAFYGAGTGEMALVGDMDPAATKPLLENVVTGWTAKQPFARTPAVFAATTPGATKIETPDKAQAIIVMAQSLPVRDDDADYASLMIANRILGGGSGLDNRLMTRLRQQEGLSYGAQSALAAGSLDRAGQFIALAIYAPQNLEKLEASAMDELKKATTEGFSADEIAKAKQGLLDEARVTRSGDAGLAGTLANYLFLGRTMQFDADFEARIAALTPDQVNATFRKYVDPTKLTVIKAGDFAKAAQAPKVTP